MRLLCGTHFSFYGALSMVWFKNEHNIFHLRFDRTQQPTEIDEFSCVDFRGHLFAKDVPFYASGYRMEPDETLYQNALRFLKDCAAFAYAQQVDTDIFWYLDGYEVFFYLPDDTLAREMILPLTALMQMSESVQIHLPDFWKLAPKDTCCMLRLHVCSHNKTKPAAT